MQEDKAEPRAKFEKPFVLIMAIGLALVVLIPSAYALLSTPAGTSYLGFQFATDDHMVYSAWMRQAMSGHFLFDNRFAIDSQPTLTINLYFWLLGIIAKGLGIALTSNLIRALLSGIFVHCLYRLIRRITSDVYSTKLALALAILGGGIGFLAWHSFGEMLVRPESLWLSKFTAGGQPVDIWQPEAFAFSSALTNGLFMASLCLILTIFNCVLDARATWRPVIPGAICFFLLMNIHSYDVQIVVFALIGLLVGQLARKQISWIWILRTIVIGLGALPPALWFMHVLREDAVFQARAATETYTSNIRMVLVGYLPLIVLGLVALAKVNVDSKTNLKKWIAISAYVLLIVTLYALAPSSGNSGYLLSRDLWLIVAVIAVGATAMLAGDNEARNLIVSWAFIGLILPYLPVLYQRKLMMGLSIPWAILAALAIASFVSGKDRSKRNLATVLSIIVLGGTSLRWIFREIEFIKGNVTRTAVQPVFLTSDVKEILAYLNRLENRRTVVLGIPGGWSPITDEAGNRIPDQFGSPALPDYNPILSGYSGVYTFAGHWSETPYMDKVDPNAPFEMSRRQMASAVFSTKTPPEMRKAIIDYSGAEYLFAPASEAYGNILFDARQLGETVAGQNQFLLIKLRR